MNKRSKQRDAILENLCSRRDHPTADELYFSLKQDMPQISLGTVYRNLNLLCDEKKIQKISVGGAEHYDGNANEHYHLHCVKCGRVVDVDMPLDEKIKDECKKYFDGEIFGFSITFRGLCSNCSKQKS